MSDEGPLDPAALRESVGLIGSLARMLGQPVAVGGAAGWRGDAADAHHRALGALAVSREGMRRDLEAAASHLSDLAPQAERCLHRMRSWSTEVASAERALAAATDAGDPVQVTAHATRLAEVRLAAARATSNAIEEFESHDRRVAVALDRLACGRVGLDVAPIVAAAKPALTGIEGLRTSLRVIYRSARVEMRRHAEGALTDRIARFERLRAYLRLLGIRRVDFGLLRDLRAHRQQLLEMSRSERQFLAYDPAGDGQVVEVFGDLASAAHVAVMVPGITTSEYTYQHHLGSAARRLQAGDPDVAVVAWLGYDTPGAGPLGDIPLTLEAIGIDLALDGADRLAHFVEWLVASRPDAHRTVIAHSYGTVVAAIAASEGLDVQDLVLVGSPGVPVARAAAFELAPGARVWAGLARFDLIDEAAAFVAFGGSSDGDGDPQYLVHGINPMHDSFGALELTFAGTFGHSGYFDDPGLALLAGIVSGGHAASAWGTGPHRSPRTRRPPPDG